MTGENFLRDYLRGGLVNAFGQTGGLTGLGPKVSYKADKGFVGSNPIIGGWAGDSFGKRGGSFGSLGSGLLGKGSGDAPSFIGGLAGSLFK